MEPGLAAAASSIETAIQGAALGAYKIARSIVPLKIHFHKLPSPRIARSSHTLNVIKGKAYIFGGDLDDGNTADNAVHAVTLPTDLALKDTDYQCIAAVAAPLSPAPAPNATKPYSDEPGAAGAKGYAGTAEEIADFEQQNNIPPPKPYSDDPQETQGSNREIDEASRPTSPDFADALENQEATEAKINDTPPSRAAHVSTAVDTKIYIFSGRPPNDLEAAPLDERGALHCFDTVSHTWSTIHPHPTQCSSGVPCPRTHAASTSTRHPLPSDEGADHTMSPIAGSSKHHEGHHGTLFVYGGVGADNISLRDVWAFDVASRIWSRWPDVPGSVAEDSSGAAMISYIGRRLWIPSDAFGNMNHLDIVNAGFDDMSGIGELGVMPGSQKWETVSFKSMPGFEETEKVVEAKMGPPKNAEDRAPGARVGAGLVPVTTGAGRDYLLLFLGEMGGGKQPSDVWSFQVHSEMGTAASLKDRVWSMIGGNQSTGEEVWAKAEIVEADGGEAELVTSQSRFAYGAGGDWGNDTAVVWGGVSEGRIQGNGWIMVAE